MKKPLRPNVDALRKRCETPGEYCDAKVASVWADKAPSDDLKFDELFSDLVSSMVRNIERRRRLECTS